MNKGRKSLLNAFSAFLQIAITGVVGIIFNKIILETFGSVYNGINATVTQIINAIMIVEGGFTLASNVALYEPWGKKDLSRINGILSATKKRFLLVGLIFFVVSGVIAFLYPLTTKTSVSYFFIVTLMFLALLPSSYNLGVTTKNRVVLLAEQKEYIISFISIATYLIGNVCAIIAIKYLNVSFLIVRAIIMCSLFVGYIAIDIYCKKKYSFISFKEKPMYNEIKGTKSVIIMKLVSVLYVSAPVIIISMIPQSGFVLASIYTVYNSVLSAVQGGLNAIVNAPRLSFGALFAEGNKKAIIEAYEKYETITFIGLSIILGTTTLVMLPFVKIYTVQVDDANYIDIILMVILIAKVFFETIHIPSGQMIQMSGDFNASKKIQSIACAILMLILIIGFVKLDLYMVLSASLVAAIVLAFLEIIYTERKILNRSIWEFVRKVIPASVICSICLYIGKSGLIVCDNFFELLVIGVITIFLVSVVTIFVYYIFNRDSLKKTIDFIFRSIFMKRKER